MAQRGVNKAIVVGNLGADPETRYTPAGTAVTNIRVATSDVWKDKHQGDQREHTEWHRVVFFARLAEVAGEYLRKGSKVYVEGRLRTRKWKNKDGQDVYTTEIIADELQMLDGKGGGNGGGQAKAEQQAQHHGAATTAGASRDDYAQGSRGGTPAQKPAASGDPGFDDALDDDIPF